MSNGVEVCGEVMRMLILMVGNACVCKILLGDVARESLIIAANVSRNIFFLLVRSQILVLSR